MKVVKFALLFACASCSLANPVKRDGANYEIKSAPPQDDVPNGDVDQSEASMSAEGVPLEFPYDKAISVDQMIFRDGEWREVEKPTVVVKHIETDDDDDDEEGDNNGDDDGDDDETPVMIHRGGLERKDNFNSEPSMSSSVEEKKIVGLNSEQSMSASVGRVIEKKDKKKRTRMEEKEKKIYIKKANSEASLSASVEFKPLEKKPKMANSEASMSASVEAKPFEKIEKIAKANSEPSMSASQESARQPDEIIVIPIDDANSAKEIDFIIEPEDEAIIKIKSNEISYNLIDSDLNNANVGVKTVKITDEEDEQQRKHEEVEKQLGLLENFYRHILGSFMASMTFGSPHPIVVYE